MAPTTGKRSSYVVNGCLAGAVLYFVLDLSSSGRGWIDFTVIGLVIAAIAWNVAQLARKLHAAAGVAGVWHVLRTLLFWIVGLFNTALIRPEEVGSWKNWLGWALVLIAAGDTVALFFKERGLPEGRIDTSEGPRPHEIPPRQGGRNT
jgi:hypothetical protein